MFNEKFSLQLGQLSTWKLTLNRAGSLEVYLTTRLLNVK